MKNKNAIIIGVLFLILGTACTNDGFDAATIADQASLSQQPPTPTPTPGPAPAPAPGPTLPPPPPPPPQEPALPYTGRVTSFPLPADRNVPYSSVGSSKHTNMASDGIRIYVSGGDWLYSATDGTWSMSLADGTWRQEVGEPIYPTLPAPHALQDGAGFVWVAARRKFLMWPGSYYPYGCPYVFNDPRCLTTTPLTNYSRGMWWFDPATRTYQQELGLFGTVGQTTGSLFGGIYDDVKEQILTFLDSGSGSLAARKWDVKNLTTLPSVPFSVARVDAFPAVYYTRAQHIKIGRDVYIIGIRTNGDTGMPLFLRWNLDTETMQELKAPPVTGPIYDKETRIGTSHGKVVWPYTTGPDGIIRGIYIYNPTTDKWYLDTQVPSYGNFIGNAVTSLPDGRIAFSGGSFGPQPTHMWFYEAP